MSTLDYIQTGLDILSGLLDLSRTITIFRKLSLVHLNLKWQILRDVGLYSERDCHKAFYQSPDLNLNSNAKPKHAQNRGIFIVLENQNKEKNVNDSEQR